MLKFILPDEIDIGIQPVLDAEKDTFEVYFSVNDKPIIEFICKQIIKIAGGDINEQLKLKPEKVILHIPDFNFPYRIEGCSLQPFNLKLRKEP